MDRCDEIREDVLAFVEGELAPHARRQVEAHLAECEACARQAALVKETLGRVRALPEPEVGDGFWADFQTAVRQRIAAETPPRPPFLRRAATWLGGCSWLQPAPALSAAAILAVLMAIGVLRSPRGPRDLPPAEVLLAGESLGIAQNLDVLEHLDVLEDLDLLEQFSVLRAPDVGRQPQGS